jgi:hypothetical protein
MSAIQMLIANIEALSPQDRSAVFAAFGFDSSKAKAAKVKAQKKPRANAGRGTAWSAFSTKIQAEHKAEMDALKIEAAAKRAAAKAAGLPAPEDTKGAHLHWCSAYKIAHEAEWLAFKATWEIEHPKVTSDDAATVVDEQPSAAIGGGGSSAAIGGGGASAAPAVAKPKRGAKKMADMTPEELASAKAKRAAKKAEKAEKASAANSETNSGTESRSGSPKTKRE